MASLTLHRQNRPRALISLVPMIDVMLILLVFFMVTSTYLDLDMIPAVQQTDQTSAPKSSVETGGTSLMIRLGADGRPVLRGQALDEGELTTVLQSALADEPLTQVIVLPLGAAKTQALISVMDIAANAGVTRLRVIRLEPRP